MDTKKESDNDLIKDIIPKPTPIDLRFKLAFALLCIVNLVCALDATILAVALPTIATALHGTAIQAFWTGTSFLLTSTIFVPIFTSLSHLISRVPILITAILFFTLGSLLCSLASNFTILLLGRSIQGIGGGGISALTNIIISDVVSLRDRGKWFSGISLMWCLGAVIGPVLGGLFAERNWRLIFYINFPFCGIGLVGLPLALRLRKREGRVLKRLKEQFDWIGSILFIGSLTAILIPLSWGGVMYPWTDYHTLLPLLLGAMGLLSFLEYTHIYTTHPLIRASIFSTTTATVNFLCTSLHGAILWSLLYYMPLYYQTAKNASPITSAIILFPFTLTMGPASVVDSVIIGLTGRYRPSLWLGWTLTLLGTLLLLSLSPNTPLATLIALQLPPGLGFGILYPAMSFAVQAPASDTDLPFAAAMFTFFRTLGQSLGVAVSGNIFQSSFHHYTQHSVILAPLQIPGDASSLVAYVKGLQEGEVKSELVKAYCAGIRGVLVLACAAAGVAMVVSLVGTRALSLEREVRTEQGWKGRDEQEGGVA
ncbi:MFS general substrate transporter [Mollisia scopiformis]|uniref:MFS general substrate transporter n=1 Tax=Mollisia scopiformis TaxID=149040 RepID=A0A194X8H9_MOLSC|nr:MFS general substrate transporter [Mollisia scopiformis]KUJ16470.1 MFS general substrate transporter [Mollisia scopiformis]